MKRFLAMNRQQPVRGRVPLAERRLFVAFLFALGTLSTVASVAQDTPIAELNRLVAQVGPVPGEVVEPLPQAQADADQAETGIALSDGFTNTPAPTHANQFAFETPQPNADGEDVGAGLTVDTLQVNGGIDVPTGAAPSPLFGAQPFTQKMSRFEEFGEVPLGEASPAGPTFPLPVSPQGYVPGPAIDQFLTTYMQPDIANPFPYPTRWANDPDNPDPANAAAGIGTQENPWKALVEDYLARPLITPPAEGRPPGEDWAHQRWEEFFPTRYLVTAQSGARENLGVRDPFQGHGYRLGEFGPGPDGVSGTADDGLYHVVFAADGFPALTLTGSTAGFPCRFHPLMPDQLKETLWTFDGTFPPKLLMARYGEPLLLRHYNGLPIDPAANRGFGSHTISTHEHNGHNPAESDGYTQAFFFSGQYSDYHWPMILAGYDSINTTATDPRAGTPDDQGGIKNIPGDWRETMSTHWFHDHMLDFTAQNVYKGNAAMMNYYSAVDRGNEGIDDGVNLRLPSGTALDWGNRDYDVNLIIAGKAWDNEGQLWFNIFNLDGMLGDRMLTNWLYNPYFDVRARRYRFRILNGSVARYMRVALVEQVEGGGGELAGPAGSATTYNRVPFYMIANDGNIMEHAVYFDGTKTVGGLTNRKGILPTQAIAERYDIVVDFAQFVPGTKLYLVNLLEHQNGRRPQREIPLADVLNGTYAPDVQNGRNTTDTTVGRFLEFRVQPYDGVDLSMNPADFVEGGRKMIPLPGFTQEELDNARHRTFEFGRSAGTDSTPWTIKTDGGAGYNMDPRRLSAAPNQGVDGAGEVEIWHLTSGGGWSHPIHVHFEEGQILKRGGVDPPEWEQWARKDVYRIGRMDDSSLTVDFAIRFREFLGSYMEHCHNTQHEDHAMLLRWDLESPGQVRVMPTPMPTWDGVGYVPSYALPTFRTGVEGGVNGVTALGAGVTAPVGEVPPIVGGGSVAIVEAPAPVDEVPPIVAVDPAPVVETPIPTEGVIASPEPASDSPRSVIASGAADSRGRVRISGSVAPGQEVESSVAGVVCQTRASGAYRCRGHALSPGEHVEIRSTAEIGNLEADASVLGTGHVNDSGWVRISGRVDTGTEISASEEGVSCRTRSFGWFTCWGRQLNPGATITVQAQQAPQVVDTGSNPGGSSMSGVDTPPAESSDENAGSQVVALVDPSEIEGEDFVVREQADFRGRVRIRGDVASGEEVHAGDPRVTCTTSALGSFLCLGRDLESLQWVTIRKQ
ncbi:MAG: multicopper oxidase domain-containing protein [Myxococcota bacterium]|nr:multicopper oxidase domain-containing protein [Myxococcota bacterium]